jgi:hypothetical protein
MKKTTQQERGEDGVIVLLLLQKSTKKIWLFAGPGHIARIRTMPRRR